VRQQAEKLQVPQGIREHQTLPPRGESIACAELLKPGPRLEMHGVVNNYLLNRWWTFRSTGSFGGEFVKFLIVSIAGLGLNELAFWLFRGQLGMGVLISQCLAILCVLPFNFIVNKLWSFKDS